MNAPAVRGNIRLGQPLGFHFSTWIVIPDRLRKRQKTTASVEKRSQEAAPAKIIYFLFARVVKILFL